MNLLAKSLLAAFSVVSVTACSMQARDLSDLSDYKEEFRQKNLNVFLKSFSDHRQGQQAVLPEGEGIMYAYKPQSLTNGNMLSFLGFYLYNSLDKKNENASNQIGIDVSLRDIETVIRTGNFASGRLGYYSAGIEARVIIRDIQRGEILDSFPIKVSENKARTTQTGRQPSAKDDRKAMIKIMDHLAIRLADEILDEANATLSDIYKLDKSLGDYIFINNAYKMVNENNATPKEEMRHMDEDELAVSPEIINAIEQQEQDLLERKDQQRILYEKKVLEQKWLEHLEDLQDQ